LAIQTSSLGYGLGSIVSSIIYTSVVERMAVWTVVHVKWW